MGRNRSLVWQFFDRIFQNGTPVSVQCKLCDQEYKYFGNTTNLKQHLVRRHPIQWEIAEHGGLNKAARQRLEEAGEKDHEVVDISDLDQETEAARSRIVQEVNMKTSDEEWLEDPFQTTQDESYEVPRKVAKQKKIKRELQSPVQQRSRLQSTPVYESELGSNTLFFPAESQPLKDEYSVFGEYIANKMRKFKSPRTRGNLQQVITTMLWQAEYGVYDNSEAVKRILMLPVDKKQPNKSDTLNSQEETSNETTEENNSAVQNES